MTGVDFRFRYARADFTLDAAASLPPAGITVLFGPSGAGKTTLLRLIAGLERADGTLTVDGRVWQDARTFVPAHRRPVGLVFQDARLFRHMSVRDNLLYGFRRVAAKRRRLALDEAVALLDLGHLLPRRPSALSGGEAQRVAIGRALLAAPDLLLLDEPLASVDARRKGEILPFLERLHRELAIPVLLVTHDVEDAVRLADTVLVLDGGRVRAQGGVTEALADAAELGGLGSLAVALELAAWTESAEGIQVTLAGGQRLVVPGGPAPGARPRLYVAARDVSVALAPQGATSALFETEATVPRVPEGEAPHVALPLDCGGFTLLALVTRRSCAALGLVAGARVHAAVHHARLI